AIDLEAAVIGESRIQQAERVWELQMVREANAIAAARAAGRGRPFADAVERKDGGLLERAGEEGAGGVAFMMIGEDEPRPGRAAKPLPQRAAQVQFFLEPDVQGQAKARKASGRKGQV